MVSGNDRNSVVVIDDVRFSIGWCAISPEAAYPPADPQPRPTALPHGTLELPSSCHVRDDRSLNGKI